MTDGIDDAAIAADLIAPAAPGVPPPDAAGGESVGREEGSTADVLAGVSRWGVSCGDVLEYLASLPPASASLVLGSPPYDGKARRYGSAENLGGQAWVDWMVEVVVASLRVCRGMVAFVVDGSTRDYRWSCTPALLIADLHRRGVHLRKPPAYIRHGIPGSGGRDWWKNNWEFVVCATHGGALPWSNNTACGKPPIYKRSGPFSNRRADGTRNHRAYTPPELANPGNVIACKVGGNQMGSKLAHANEAPYPEVLVERFVRSFCEPGGIVVDPFAGSGTTGAVAVRWGRRHLGCDVRGEQVELARRRIAESLAAPLPAADRLESPPKPRGTPGNSPAKRVGRKAGRAAENSTVAYASDGTPATDFLFAGDPPVAEYYR